MASPAVQIRSASSVVGRTPKQRPYTAPNRRIAKIRVVPPFSIESLQKNTTVQEPNFSKKCKKFFKILMFSVDFDFY